MKKILFLGGLLLSAMTFVSCNGDYDDWADPQSNPQEEALLTDSVYQERVAWNIFMGIMQELKTKKA